MGLAMLGIDPDVGHLRFWVASGAAALLVLVCALALDWTRSRVIARLAVIGLGAAFGAILAWAFLAGAAVRDLTAERHNLEMRAAQLAAQVLAPGSPLACLDATGGENVEAACEKALFAAPATVAAASSYTFARLALLSDMTISTRSCPRCAAVLRRIVSVLWPIRWRCVTVAPAIVVQPLGFCAIPSGCVPISARNLSIVISIVTWPNGGSRLKPRSLKPPHRPRRRSPLPATRCQDKDRKRSWSLIFPARPRSPQSAL
jgi:hypothetical protein